MSITIAPFTAGASEFAGTWQITQEFQGQERTSTWVIDDADGRVSVTITGGRGSGEVDNAKIADGVLAFTRTVERQGQSFEMKHEARIQDGKLVVTVMSPRGERTMTGVRVQEEAGFVGKWDVILDFQGREVPVTLTIAETEDGGMWSSQRGESALEGVSVADGTISFQRKMERDGQEIVLDHTARIEDGKLVGAVVSPMGEMPFTGTRAAAVAEGAEVDRAAEMLARMDANKDGFVSEDEAPEQMKQYFQMIDADASGTVDKAELEVVVQMMGQRDQNQ
ncbi:MAG: hypothetical protein WD873_04460 [Candidatus Hydrogenedentales bacterium]